jgi:hypothetical protein
MYLLADEEEIATTKAAGLKTAREETQQAKNSATAQWDQLFSDLETA